MHPTTWGIVRRSKDSTGQYLLAADPSQGWNPTLFGVPVVLTTQIAVGTVLIGDFAGIGRGLRPRRAPYRDRQSGLDAVHGEHDAGPLRGADSAHRPASVRALALTNIT